MQELQPGQLFANRYSIERQLGAGGFSWVYRALDQTNGRRVALKVLRPEREGYSNETRVRFDREVRIIAGLTHTNTITLFDSGESPDGTLFMVFELIDGEDLSALLARRGTLPRETVITILRQVLGSLGEAHNAGLVHRDIKPENVRVKSAPGAAVEVKLLDFGIARGTERAARVTKTGELVGTPRYMSPEQLMDAELSPASDIYSLGMVALELVAGAAALPGGRWTDQIDRLRTGHVMAAPTIEAVGPDFLAVIHRMTARNPAQRFSRTSDVLAALDQLQKPATRRLPGRPTHATSPSVMTLTLTGLAMVVAISVVTYWILREPEPPARVLPRPSAAALTKQVPTVSRRPPSAIVKPIDDAGGDVAAVELEELPPYASSGCRSKPSGLGPNVVTPSGYDPNVPHPVVIWLRSDSADGNVTPRSTMYNEVRNEAKFITLIPRPPQLNWLEHHSEVVADELRLTGEHYCVDRRRIFITATAAGGHLAARLACEPWISAVAIASSAEMQGRKHTCESPRPMLYMGARDSLHQPVAGGADCFGRPRRSQSDIIDERKRWNGCSGSPKLQDLDGVAECRTFKCDVPLVECFVQGGLGWPGAPAHRVASWGGLVGCAEPAPSPTFDGMRHAWEFFAEQEPLDDANYY